MGALLRVAFRWLLFVGLLFFGGAKVAWASQCHGIFSEESRFASLKQNLILITQVESELAREKLVTVVETEVQALAKEFQLTPDEVVQRIFAETLHEQARIKEDKKQFEHKLLEAELDLISPLKIREEESKEESFFEGALVSVYENYFVIRSPSHIYVYKSGKKVLELERDQDGPQALQIRHKHFLLIRSDGGRIRLFNLLTGQKTFDQAYPDLKVNSLNQIVVSGFSNKLVKNVSVVINPVDGTSATFDYAVSQYKEIQIAGTPLLFKQIGQQLIEVSDTNGLIYTLPIIGQAFEIRYLPRSDEIVIFTDKSGTIFYRRQDMASKDYKGVDVATQRNVGLAPKIDVSGDGQYLLQNIGITGFALLDIFAKKNIKQLAEVQNRIAHLMFTDPRQFMVVREKGIEHYGHDGKTVSLFSKFLQSIHKSVVSKEDNLVIMQTNDSSLVFYDTKLRVKVAEFPLKPMEPSKQVWLYDPELKQVHLADDKRVRILQLDLSYQKAEENQIGGMP